MKRLSRLAVGFAAAGWIAEFARRRGQLTADGALAAAAVGSLIYAGRGLGGTLLTLGFFASSSALSRVGRAEKRACETVEKTGPRDAAQVLANGGIAALAALIPAGGRGGSLFATALATATADTWATEIGTVRGGSPRSLLDGRSMAIGLSGGVTDAGTAAGIAGALFIGLLSNLSRQGTCWSVMIGGVAGCLADSVLGMGVQVLRRCVSCGLVCELDVHCASTTEIVRGISFFTNDTVNLSATAAGAAVGMLLSG